MSVHVYSHKGWNLILIALIPVPLVLELLLLLRPCPVTQGTCRGQSSTILYRSLKFIAEGVHVCIFVNRTVSAEEKRGMCQVNLIAVHLSVLCQLYVMCS
jgi:hypothetical protein